MSEIIVPSAPSYTLLEIKRSKFHCHIERADTAEAAHLLVARLRLQYPDANHVCSAFVAGRQGNTTQIGCSDDGEPSGTAGKPMLNVLMHAEVSFVAAAVARTFGGTKLGTGGLARAYSGAVTACIAQLQSEVLRILTAARFSLPYPFEAQARHLLQKYDAELQTMRYAEMVEMDVLIEGSRLGDFALALKDSSAGQCVQLTSD